MVCLLGISRNQNELESKLVGIEMDWNQNEKSKLK